MLRRNCALGEMRQNWFTPVYLVPECLAHRSVILLMFLGIHVWKLVQKVQFRWLNYVGIIHSESEFIHYVTIMILINNINYNDYATMRYLNSTNLKEYFVFNHQSYWIFWGYWRGWVKVSALVLGSWRDLSLQSHPLSDKFLWKSSFLNTK